MYVAHPGTSSARSGLKPGYKGFSGKIFISLLLLVTATEAWPWGSDPTCPPGPEPICPLNPIYDAENYFDHPTDCHYFIHCDGARRPICQQCSPRTYFSTTVKNCVWPIDAACKHNDTTRPEGLLPPICAPGSCDLPNGKMRDYENCRYYWKCEGEKKVRKICPTDQHFNARIRECQDKCKAGCEMPTTIPGCNGCKNGDCNEITPMCPDGTTKFKTCDTYEICEGGRRQTRKCPLGQIYDAASYTHCIPGDCDGGRTDCPEGTTKFKTCDTYEICEGGRRQTRKCALGQIYDAASYTHCSPGICVDKSKCLIGETVKINCSTYSVCEKNIWRNKTCDENQHFNDASGTCVNGPCKGCPPGETTSEDPCSCNMYYKCENGERILSMCEDGLHYNATNHRCELPCTEVCSKLFFRKPECCASTKGKPEPICPSSYYSIFFPHPSDSSWFYHCKKGVRYCNRCPSGYRWNIDEDKCDKACLCP